MILIFILFRKHGKTIAQKGAHVVKDGIRHKDVYATAVGDVLFCC